MTYTFAAAQGGKVGGSICEPDMFPRSARHPRAGQEEGRAAGHVARRADRRRILGTTPTPRRRRPTTFPTDGRVWTSARRARRSSASTSWAARPSSGTAPWACSRSTSSQPARKEVAQAIAEATKNGAYSLIGGGDSVACINKFGLADQVSLHLDGRRRAARIHRIRRPAGRCGHPRLTGHTVTITTAGISGFHGSPRFIKPRTT